MAIFVGYPISYETACHLFNQSVYTDIAAVIKPTGFELVYTDKGQYLLGVHANAANLWDPFVDVDTAIIALLEAKRAVKALVEKCNLDLSDLPLQEMDGEAIQSHNPQPLVFSGAF
jgi:hypothetical protein